MPSISIALLQSEAYPLVPIMQSMKIVYPKLMHITCIRHTIHRVCEFVRDKHQLADEAVCFFKKLLARSRRKRNLLADLCGRPVPPSPIEMRWETWLDYCDFINQHYDKIRQFSSLISEGDAISAKKLADTLESSEVRHEFVSISALELIIGPRTKKSYGLFIY